MKKILTVACALATAASATPYVGIKAGLNFMRSNVQVSHKNETSNSKVEAKTSMNRSLLALGALAGNSFKINDSFDALTEADFEYNFVSKEAILSEDINVKIKQKFSFGFMPAVKYNYNANSSGLLGVRVSLNQNTLSAKHLLSDKPLSQKSTYLAIEPTIGFQAKISDKISGRLTLGYLFAQKKTSASKSFSPRKVSINLSSNNAIRITGNLIYSF